MSYSLKARLEGKSDKSQRYILRTILGASKTRVDIYYYRLKRDHLAAEVAELKLGLSERDARFGFGQSNIQWAGPIADKVNTRRPEVDTKALIGQLVHAADKFDAYSDYSMLYREAMELYAAAGDAIESGDYKDMNEAHLQLIFYFMRQKLPSVKHKGCGHD